MGDAPRLFLGSTIALEALFAGPISRASMNPARSLGPAVVGGNAASLWIYILAPIFGASAGVIACRLVRDDCLGR
ncbi:MAG: aquaporin [Chthoniobacterales bacterium]